MKCLKNFVVGLVLGLSASGVQVYALDSIADKADPVVHLSKAQTADFQSALEALASQGHVALVAEGVPMKTILTAKDAPDALKGVPLADAVTRVASAYDYDVERIGSAFVLKKRYTDSHDLPGITLEECQQSCADIVQVLDSFSPHYPYSIRRDNGDDQALQFVGTLSPAQEQAMQNKALHYGGLSPDQQALIRTAFLYVYVQMPLMQVRAALDPIQQAPHAALVVSAGRSNPKLFMTTVDSHGTQYLLPLSQGVLVMAAANVLSPGGLQAMPKPKPDEKTFPLATTLGQIVMGLTVGERTAGIDSGLRDKPIVVAGLSAVTPMNALRALASVYGLRIGATDQGAPKITYRSLSLPGDLQSLPDAVRAALPEPFLRASRAREALPATLPRMDQAGDLAAIRRRRQASAKNTRKRQENEQRPDDIRAEAVRRLIDQLRLHSQLDRTGLRTPTTSLSPAERGYLAVALMGSAVAVVDSHFAAEYSSPVTACLRDFEQTLIYGKPHADPNVPGRMTHSLLLRGVDPTTGRTVGLGGFGIGD